VKRRGLALLLGIGLVLGAFGIGEALLAYFGPAPGYSQFDRLTRWSLRPGYSGPGPDLPDVPLSYQIRVNADGFRGAPIDRRKRAGTFRIAALGDSVTFGFGVPEEGALPARVAALLAADVAPGTIEWINAGVPGFSSFQGLRHLETRLLPLSPDVVLVLFAWNDGWQSNMPDAKRRQLSRMETFINSFRVVNLAQRKYESLMRKLGVQPAAPAGGSVTRVTPDELEANLQRIAAAVRGAGGVPVFLTAPAAFGPDRPPDAYFRYGWMVPRSGLEAMRGRYADATRRAARSADVLLVDCARLVPSDPALFLGDGYHPNPAGFQVMAEQIADALRQAHVAPRRR
jgi:lysophospholipase L1-like esterase